MRRTLIPGIILLAGFPFSALADDIAGTYAVAGFDTINKPYSTTVKITMTGEAKCQIQMATFSTTVTGDCMVTKDTVAVHARLDAGQHSMGIYRRGADGVLTGTWTHSAYKGTGRETLTPVD